MIVVLLKAVVLVISVAIIFVCVSAIRSGQWDDFLSRLTLFSRERAPTEGWSASEL
jgi:hypothetical protein